MPSPPRQTDIPETGSQNELLYSQTISYRSKKMGQKQGFQEKDLKDLGQAVTLIDSDVQGLLGSVDFTGPLRIHKSLKLQQTSFRVSSLVGLSVHSQGPWLTPIFSTNSHSVLAGIP